MKNNKPNKHDNLRQSIIRHQESVIKSRVNSEIDKLISQFDNADSTEEQVTIINRLDEIVTAELMHWTNILSTIPDDCPPCLELRGKDAEYWIAELTPLLQHINTTRLQLINS